MEPVVEAIAKEFYEHSQSLDFSRHQLRQLPKWMELLCQYPRSITRDQIDDSFLDLLNQTTSSGWENEMTHLNFLIEATNDLEEADLDERYDSIGFVDAVTHARELLRENQAFAAGIDPDFRLVESLESLIDVFGPGYRSGPEFEKFRKTFDSVVTRVFTRAIAPVAAAVRRVRSVNLALNDLREFPALFSHLPKLQYLSLEDNPQMRIQGWGSRAFESLNVLNLSNAILEATELTNEIFPVLDDLRLDNCRIENSVALKLPSLTQLSMYSMSTGAAVEVDSPNLEVLLAGDSNVSNLEGLLNQLNELIALDISLCGLESVPEIASVNLEELSLAGNDLQGDDFSSLPRIGGRMRFLDLSACQLSEVPESAASLSQLGTLSISDNPISLLPAWLGSMPELNAIDLEGLPLPELVSAASEGGVQDLKRFLLELGSRPSECREGKMLVVGEGTIGKTSLIGALRGDEFVEHRKTTHGIEVRRIHPEKDEKIPTTIISWDFGGQEVYRITHPFFFSRDALYLVGFRPRDGVEQSGVLYWLEAIRHRIGIKNCKIILVATWADEGRTSRLDFEALEWSFHPAIVGHKSVDSRSRSGIDDLLGACIQAVREFPQYGNPIPESWDSLRRVLPTIGKSFLMLKEYEEIAAVQGLSSEGARSCARLLHTLGDILYFDESDGLASLIVIDPEILARSVSYVLEDEETRGNDGVIALTRLRALWEEHDPELKANPDMFGVLVGLMQRFDIAYLLPQDDVSQELSLLIAEMLPFRRPLSLPWEPGDAPTGDSSELRVRYVFESSPTGLIPWLIVRNHRHLTPYRWGSGALFENVRHGAQCLVEIDREGLTLDVTCRGAFPTELFMTIKLDIDRLLENRWPYLPRKASLPCPNRWRRECRGFFEYEYVTRALSAQRAAGECRECLEEVSLSALISGVGEIVPSAEVVLRRLEEMSQRNVDSNEQLAEIALSIRFMRTELGMAADDSPTLFSLNPISGKGRKMASLLKQQFSLWLWCEHREGPHPMQESFTVELPRQWLERAMPTIRFVTAILKLAPIVKDAASLASDAAADVSDALRSAIDGIEFLEDATDYLEQSGAVPSGSSATMGAEQYRHRVLRMLLESLDPYPSSYAGLVRIVPPGLPVIWVCKQHAPEYQLSPQLV